MSGITKDVKFLSLLVRGNKVTLQHDEMIVCVSAYLTVTPLKSECIFFRFKAFEA